MQIETKERSSWADEPLITLDCRELEDEEPPIESNKLLVDFLLCRTPNHSFESFNLSRFATSDEVFDLACPRPPR